MDFMSMELTRKEKWVSEYELLVDHISEGYEDNIYEYTNDLTCRLFIQQALEKKDKELLPLAGRIEMADTKLRSVLLETKECIHGDYPKHYFWFWGIPRNSKELRDDAKSMGWI